MKNYARQLDLFNPAKLGATPIKIIGVGSVGSFTALTLAKMGMRDIEVWDRDFVSEHNRPNSFFRACDINRPKIEALHEIIDQFEDTLINGHEEVYNGQELGGIVISAVDSMDTRKFIWEQVQKQKNRLTYYIDTRMGGELMKIYPISMVGTRDWNFYEQTLHTRGELQLKCTERTILYNVLTIAGLTANLVKKVLTGEYLPKSIIFDLKTLQFYKED